MISITVSGRVGADAELRRAGESDVLSFRMASNDFRHKEKVTDWVSVSLFGKRAATLVQYVTKGASIVVRGKAYVRTYQNRDGQTVAALEVDATDVELLGGKPDGAQAQAPRYGQSGAGNAAKHSAPVDVADDYPADDIPFARAMTCADWTRP